MRIKKALCRECRAEIGQAIRDTRYEKADGFAVRYRVRIGKSTRNLHCGEAGWFAETLEEGRRPCHDPRCYEY